MSRLPIILAIVLGLALRVASADPAAVPWQLAPTTTQTVLRVDSAVAAFDDASGNLDVAGTTILSASYRWRERWAPLIRLGLVGNDAPGAARDGTSVANPVVGLATTRVRGRRRLVLLAAAALPLGAGGGDHPDPRTTRTNAASIIARPADEAMFAVDYLTATVGADLAYVTARFTAQAEANLQQGVRVRGADGPVATDAGRTRAALGLHAGGRLGWRVWLGADLLYQRWLSEPTMRDPGSLLTLAAGVRVHLRVGAVTLRPGLAYTRGLGATADGPMMLTERTNAISLDLPVLF